MSELPPAPDPSTMNAAPKVQLTHKQILIIFSGLMLGMFLAALDNTIVNTALTSMVSDLGGQSQITWVVTSYLLTSTITILLWGKLSDIHGRKRMFQLAIGVFLAASALVGLSPNMMFLVAARGLQGIGAGGIMSLAFAIIGDILSPRERGKYMGLMGLVFLVAMIIGPALGGLIVEHFNVWGIANWRWVFYINLPLGIPALFITQIVLRMPVDKRDEKIDWRGFALLAVGTSSLILGLTWGGQAAPFPVCDGSESVKLCTDHAFNLRWWPGVGDAAPAQAPGAPAVALGALEQAVGDWLVPVMLTAGLGLLGMFILAERNVKAPLLPLSMFKSRTYALGSIVSFGVGAAMFGGFVFLPTYLQMSTGVSATMSGFLMLPLMAGMFPSLTISGRLVSKTGRYKIWPVVGLPIGTAGLLWLSTIGANSPLWYVAIGMFLLGCGIGMTMQVIVVAVQNELAPRDLGIGTSANTFMRQMGGVFGVGIFGAVFADKIIHLAKEAIPVAIQNGVAPDKIGASFRASPEIVKGFPEALQVLIKGGFADAVSTIFLMAAPVMLLSWVVVLFIKETPLKTSRGVDGAAPAATGAPTNGAGAATNGATASTGASRQATAAPQVARPVAAARTPQRSTPGVRLVARPARPPLGAPPSASGDYSYEEIKRRVDAMPWPKTR